MGALCEKPNLEGDANPSAGIVSGKLVPKKKLQVFGNCFNGKTRTVLTLLDIANVDY